MGFSEVLTPSLYPGLAEGHRHLPGTFHWPILRSLACHTRDFFGESFGQFFTETIPDIFQGALNAIITLFRNVFIAPFISAWHSTRDFFSGSFVKFFTDTIPGVFRRAWDSVIGFFRRHFVSPFFTVWHSTRDFFLGSFTRFFTETIPRIFTGALNAAIGIFRQFFVAPFFEIWFATRDFFRDDFTKFFTEVVPEIFRQSWEFIRKIFIGAANGLITVLNQLIEAIGRLPIPRVTVGVAYANIGPLRIPYPTFSVSTAALSSFIGSFTVPSIATNAGTPERLDFRAEQEAGRLGNREGFGTTNNYYSLAANDFDSRAVRPCRQRAQRRGPRRGVAVMASVTVPLTGISVFDNYIRWSDNQSLGSVFDAGGTEQVITFVDVNNAGPAGRVTLSIVGFNNRFTTAFEASGRVIFEASDGEILEVTIGDADTSEPYSWVPTNSAQVIAFALHVKGLADQDATLTLTDEDDEPEPEPEPGTRAGYPGDANPCGGQVLAHQRHDVRQRHRPHALRCRSLLEARLAARPTTSATWRTRSIGALTLLNLGGEFKTFDPDPFVDTSPGSPIQVEYDGIRLFTGKTGLTLNQVLPDGHRYCRYADAWAACVPGPVLRGHLCPARWRTAHR